jgi:hypothetical protein
VFAIHKEDLGFAVKTVLLAVRMVNEAGCVAESGSVDTPFAV